MQQYVFIPDMSQLFSHTNTNTYTHTEMKAAYREAASPFVVQLFPVSDSDNRAPQGTRGRRPAWKYSLLCFECVFTLKLFLCVCLVFFRQKKAQESHHQLKKMILKASARCTHKQLLHFLSQHYVTYSPLFLCRCGSDVTTYVVDVKQTGRNANAHQWVLQ